MTTRADIVNEARSWVGTRWHHQAAERGVGTDCIGLVVGVAHRLGITDARASVRSQEFCGYGRQPNPETLLAACRQYLEPLADVSYDLGDILLMRFTREPQHVAIVSQRDPDYIIHAYAQARGVVENRLDANWRGRICSSWRFRGIE